MRFGSSGKRLSYIIGDWWIDDWWWLMMIDDDRWLMIHTACTNFNVVVRNISWILLTKLLFWDLSLERSFSAVHFVGMYDLAGMSSYLICFDKNNKSCKNIWTSTSTKKTKDVWFSPWFIHALVAAEPSQLDTSQGLHRKTGATHQQVRVEKENKMYYILYKLLNYNQNRIVLTLLTHKNRFGGSGGSVGW